MKRRAFISMLAGTAGGLALPKWRIPDPVIILPPVDTALVVLRYNVTQEQLADNLYKFGMAPLKQEGGLLLFDNFKKILAPGLKKVWDDHYKKLDKINWEDLFK